MKRFFPLVLVMLMVALSSLAGSYYWQDGEMVQGPKINYALDEKGDAASITTSLNLKYDKTGGALTGPVQVTSSTDSTFLGGGDVGIGTNTPNALLHVNGYFQASMPIVVYQATPATYTTGVVCIASYGTKIIDTHNAFSNSVFTAPARGIYCVAGTINWDGSAAGQRDIYIYAGGVAYSSNSAPAIVGGQYQNISAIVYADTGAQIVVYGYQNTGGDLNSVVGNGAKIQIVCLQKMN